MVIIILKNNIDDKDDDDSNRNDNDDNNNIDSNRNDNDDDNGNDIVDDNNIDDHHITPSIVNDDHTQSLIDHKPSVSFNASSPRVKKHGKSKSEFVTKPSSFEEKKQKRRSERSQRKSNKNDNNDDENDNNLHPNDDIIDSYNIKQRKNRKSSKRRDDTKLDPIDHHQKTNTLRDSNSSSKSNASSSSSKSNTSSSSKSNTSSSSKSNASSSSKSNASSSSKSTNLTISPMDSHSPKIMDKKSPSSIHHQKTLLSILSDSNKDSFLKFLQSNNYNDVYIHLLDSIQEFKDEPSDSKSFHMAKRIIDRYFPKKMELSSLRFDQKTRKDLIEKLDAFDTLDKKSKRSLFRRVEKEIIRMMATNYLPMYLKSEYNGK